MRQNDGTEKVCVNAALSCALVHLCPVCRSTVHAICGQICEEASIQFHTTCFKCLAHYDMAFKDPETFHAHQSLRKTAPDQQQASHAVVDAAPDISLDAFILPLEIDLYKSGLNDPATVKNDKAKKRREFIKALTHSQCTIAQEGDLSLLVSIGGVPLSRLLLNDPMLFCATHKISGFRQKKKDEVALLIASIIVSDNIYASIGQRGLTMEKDGTAAAFATSAVVDGKQSLSAASISE